MDTDNLAGLQNHKYINLETFRKNGQGVKTPVWFMISDGLVFVVTTENRGKVKRIKNNPKVRLMPCGMRGEPKGDWIDGTARFANESESQNAMNLRNKKYGFRAKIIGMFIKKEKPIAIAIQI